MSNRRARSNKVARTVVAAALLALAPSVRMTQDLAESTASQPLEVLVDEFLGWVRERRDPLDISLNRVEEQAGYASTVLERLGAIQHDELDYEERLTAPVLEWEARTLVEELETYWYGFPYTPYGPLRSVRLDLASRSFQEEEELDQYLELLVRYQELFVAIREQAAGQRDRGVVLPVGQLEPSIRFLQGFLRPPEASPFFVPVDQLTAFPEERARSFQQEVTERVSGSINPAVEALIAFVDELRPGAPPGVGIGQLPGGREAYRRLIRAQTTLDATPEEIHAIGLAAVDSLNAEMARVRQTLGFSGTKAEFHEELRRDGRLFASTPEEFGERLMAHDARIRPLIPEAFSTEPETPYGVRRLDPRLEPELTYGYYRRPGPGEPRGLYFFNGSELNQRSLLSGAALMFHELVPGHHFQINLVRENETLPAFHRHVRYSGYSEGWSEYASSVVARELGLYEDPYDYYGRLVFDMFFAVRLVVDTGLNYLDWTLDQAREFMLDNTMESRVQVDSETLRFTHWPAQAAGVLVGAAGVRGGAVGSGTGAGRWLRHPAVPRCRAVERSASAADPRETPAGVHLTGACEVAAGRRDAVAGRSVSDEVSDRG